MSIEHMLNTESSNGDAVLMKNTVHSIYKLIESPTKSESKCCVLPNPEKVKCNLCFTDISKDFGLIRKYLSANLNSKL